MINYQEHAIRLLENVRTREEADAIRDALTAFEAALFRSDPTALEQVAKQRLPHRMGNSVLEAVAAVGRTGGPGAAQQLFKELKHQLAARQILNIEIAFDPTESTIETLTAWIRAHVGADIILDLRVDKTIEGGIRMTFRGRFREVTLRHMISDILQNEQQRILESL